MTTSGTVSLFLDSGTIKPLKDRTGWGRGAEKTSDDLRLLLFFETGLKRSPFLKTEMSAATMAASQSFPCGFPFGWAGQCLLVNEPQRMHHQSKPQLPRCCNPFYSLDSCMYTCIMDEERLRSVGNNPGFIFSAGKNKISPFISLSPR